MVPCKIPKEGSKQQIYQVMMHMNHNNDHQGVLTLRVQWWHHTFVITNNSLIGLSISKPSLVLEPSKQLNELLANKECKEVENNLFQGTAHKLIIQYQMVSLETCIRVTLYRLNRLRLEVCVHTYQQLMKKRL